MSSKPSGLKVLDLFCGAGGFSEGFRQAGFDIIMGIDNWQTALDSHAMNGLGVSLNYDMFNLIEEGGYKEAKRLAKEIEENYGPIDVLIGSPPCTEFSYAKKGGKGDIEKGMLLVRAHLVMVAALQPTFWLMENVPRLKNAITSESTRENSHGWYVDFERLGVNEDVSDSPLVDNNSLIVPYGEIYVASDYGAPQKRKRFIAGNLDPKLVFKLKTHETRKMGDIICKLEDSSIPGKRSISDPNYPHHKIKRDLLRDYFYDTRLHPMYWEEMRHLKKRHIQYGKMVLPDDMERPARTIMATPNPSSRETITINTRRKKTYQGKKRPVLRQPTVREVACIQGFPISFQFSGKSLNTRYKQIGNAVPCQLAYSMAISIFNMFENVGFEDSTQEMRYQVTRGRWVKNGEEPIISGPLEFIDEAEDFEDKKYLTFKARDKKHIRRRLLSAKPKNSSAMVIFENTDWDSRGKRFGGFWKSCIQVGVGKIFSQVYLDSTSIPSILTSIISYFKSTSKDEQTTLDDYSLTRQIEGNGLEKEKTLRNLITQIFREVDYGIPLVNDKWIDFPGYSEKEAIRYLGYRILASLKLPSAKEFQTMFTSHYPDTKGCIGPIDLFDGLDLIMLRNLTTPDARWILKTEILVDELSDSGDSLHKNRISRDALYSISGSLPLVTIIGGLVSIHVLYRMHNQDKPVNNSLFKSLKSAWKDITSYLRYI